MITKEQVKQILIHNHVPEDSYSLEGGFLPERYCLSEVGYKWEVYYSERGLKSGLRQFDTEAEACDYFLIQLRKAGLLKN
jgi:hypothetical protein